MTQSILLASAYLPPVSYVALLRKAPRVFIEQKDYYERQSYRNRCHIIGPNGLQPLSIPVEKPQGKVETGDVVIAHHADWSHQHWNAICTAYNSAPYFEYYADDLYPFFKNAPHKLHDLNMNLLQTILKLLEIEVALCQTNKYEQSPMDVLDVRELFHPKRELFFSTEERVKSISYYQVFSRKYGFVENLSILDLLFNMGPESLLVLEKMLQ